MQQHDVLFNVLELPCGVVLKNRIAKSAMSDSLGDGTGHPTSEQNRLYQRWADGGLAISIIGEVQATSNYAEKPGNLVLDANADMSKFRELAALGTSNNTQLWLQLGHAGALAYAPISNPKGPSALDLPDLRCVACKSMLHTAFFSANFCRHCLTNAAMNTTGPSQIACSSCARPLRPHARQLARIFQLQ